jgi:pimeloyl-ACP methyl ester carboxylesterase
MTNQIELSTGTLDYEDTGGEGPVVVLLGGLMMDASLWEDVIADLSPSTGASRRRCRWARIATR